MCAPGSCGLWLEYRQMPQPVGGRSHGRGTVTQLDTNGYRNDSFSAPRNGSCYDARTAKGCLTHGHAPTLGGQSLWVR